MCYLQVLSNDRVIDELEVMWKKVCVTYSRYFSVICLEGLSKIMKALNQNNSDAAEIQTGHNLEKSLVHYSSTILFVISLS
jgi:hypothetical protein